MGKSRPGSKKASPIVLWITGLPGSGKSTYADAVRKSRPEFIVLRMDELRKIATPAPSYSDGEREILYRSLVFTAKALSEAGHPVIIDATGHRRKWRALARKLMPGFVEVYLECPVGVCMERERRRLKRHAAPRGVYEKGRAGWPVPGLAVPYEKPLSPDVKIQTDALGPDEGLETINKLLKDRRCLK